MTFVCSQFVNKRALCALIDCESGYYGNILEAYCPTISVKVQQGRTECKRTLFDGYMFVLATHNA